ncbi:MAG: hypothetical protein PHX80_03980 [Candidatus Nanoarchaeia archaeon]|nr:hypothetical protein [Candidatus Nanoarchaeia archaeon]
MKYQDSWLNGGIEEKGIRECSSRYEIIKSFCNKYKGSFSICDIGANMCYFGLRLIEDFPDCVVIAFEYNQVKMRQEQLKKNKVNKLILFDRKINLNDIAILIKTCHFNLVLALSVLHHVPGSVSEWMNKLKLLGDDVIIELAANDSHRIEKCIDYTIPSDATILGYGESHLDNFIKRPIILL